MVQLLFNILCIYKCMQWDCDLGQCRLWLRPWIATDSYGYGWPMDLGHFPWWREVKGPKGGNVCPYGHPKVHILKPGVLSSQELLYLGHHEQIWVSHPGLEWSPLTPPAKGQQVPFVRNRDIYRKAFPVLEEQQQTVLETAGMGTTWNTTGAKSFSLARFSSLNLWGWLVLLSSSWAWSRLQMQF